VAAFTHNCGLKAWKKNSQVIHAVSDMATGPFRFLDIALPVWHHNPQIIRHTDGTYLIFSIGLSPEPIQENCTKGETGYMQGLGPQELVQLHYASTVYGPWSLLTVDGNSNLFTGTNPSPWVNGDGSIVVGSHNNAGFTVSTAPHWKGPYTPAKLVFSKDPVYNLEDPFIWFDQSVQKWKVLFHQYNSTDPAHQIRVGGYAVSSTTDLFGEWLLQSNETPAYNITVNFQDGSKIDYNRRERPKLLLNTDGTPAVLYTGVCYRNDKCYTIAQIVQN